MYIDVLQKCGYTNQAYWGRVNYNHVSWSFLQLINLQETCSFPTKMCMKKMCISLRESILLRKCIFYGQTLKSL